MPDLSTFSRYQAPTDRYARTAAPASMQQLYTQLAALSGGGAGSMTLPANAPYAQPTAGGGNFMAQLMQMFGGGGNQTAMPMPRQPIGSAVGGAPTQSTMPFQLTGPTGGFTPYTLGGMQAPNGGNGMPYTPGSVRMGAPADPRASYIDNLYSGLLGRRPDAAGFQTQMNSGLSLDQITQNFLKSPEYLGLHGGASAGAAPGTVPTAPVAGQFARGGRVRGAAAPRRGRAFLVQGRGDGRSDNVPTRLPRGAQVIPADVVAAKGNGSTMAGARLLGAQPASGGGIAMAMGGGMPAALSDGEVVMDGPTAASRGANNQDILRTRSGFRRHLGRLPGPR